MSEATVSMRCPACSRFIGEASGYGRAVCRCGWELTVRSPSVRKREGGIES